MARNQSNGFFSAHMLIDNYYNSLNRQVDLLTEDQLKKYEKDERSVLNDLEDTSTTGQEVSIKEYLELTRSRTIKEIERVKEVNIDYYEAHKDNFEADVKEARKDAPGAIEALRKKLFANKFCFLVREQRFFDANLTLDFNQPYVVDFYFNPKNVVQVQV